MENLIRDAENVDLSADDIKTICKGQVEIVVYHNLSQYQSLQEVLGQYGAVILLYETKQNFGHWTALIDQGDHIEFFDSYGFKPDEELNYATYDNTPYLSNLIKTSSKPIIPNLSKLQAQKEDVNTCGRWTSMRVRLRNIPLHKFVELMKNNQKYTGDFWVSALTYLYTFNQ
tara:strand:- start:1928 stop:2443 length:516 start_codon:yes stop_codon:yes gene_type:complete